MDSLAVLAITTVVARYTRRTANGHPEKAVEPPTALATTPIDINAADLYMIGQRSVAPEGQMIDIMCVQYCSGPGCWRFAR